MAPAQKTWTFNYLDLCRITGKTENTVQKDRSRGRFDPNDLESVIIYAARNAKIEIRAKMLFSSLEKELLDAMAKVSRQEDRKRKK